jgi:hypothetical protein
VDEDHSEHFDAINLLLPKALDKIFISCHWYLIVYWYTFISKNISAKRVTVMIGHAREI